jgi:hypothetical protein
VIAPIQTMVSEENKRYNYFIPPKETSVGRIGAVEKAARVRRWIRQAFFTPTHGELAAWLGH